MYNLASAYRFLNILATAHRAMKPKTTFTFISLLNDCGYDADDYSGILELDGIYQYWHDQRIAAGKTSQEADAMASQIAAGRVGTVLSQVLKADFAGTFKVEPDKEPGRWDGRVRYTWL